MADESVGKIQLDIEISKGSVSNEIGSFNKTFSNSFKSMFSGMATQTNSFVKNTIGGIANGFKSFAQIGSKSNQEVAQSTEESRMKLESLTAEMSNASNQAELYRQKLKSIKAELAGLSSMPYADEKRAKLEEQLLKAEASMIKYANASDTARLKIEKLEQSTNQAEETTKKTGKAIEQTATKAHNAGKKMNGFAAMINRSFMTILRRLFIYNLIYKAIRGMINYMGSALKTNSEFSKSLNVIKTNLRVAFQPIYDFILPAINALMRGLATATTYIATAISALFGKTYKESFDAAKGLDDAKKKMEGYGKAAKKTKGTLAGFDEINQLDIRDEEESGGAAAGEFVMTMPDLATSNTEKTFSRLSSIYEDFFNNWGMKDIFAGIREGLKLVNFDIIRDNFKTAFGGLGEIAKTYLTSLQPIYQAAGQALGTFLKYGIAIVGNIFEPISLGFANFVTNMKGPIQEWIVETSGKMATGFNNLNIIFEVIGQSWLNSIEKYKEPIANVVEGMYTNIANTFMLIGTILADIFAIITGNIKDFATKNQVEIQIFTDSIIDIFTSALDFVNNIWSDVLESISTFWDDWGKGIVDGAIRIVTDIGGWFLYLWNDLVKPVWDTMMKWLKKIWDDSLKGIVKELLGFVGRVGDLIVKLWDHMKPYWEMLLTFVVPLVKGVVQTIIDIAGNLLNTIGGIIKNLIKVINGIIDFVVGVFTLDWKRAWEGIKSIFDGIVGTFEGVFKGMINGLISIVNFFIRFWNGIELKVPKVDIPLLGEVGGFSIGVPKIGEIPYLAKGGIVDQPTLAMVGERGKEAVMPLENNTGWIMELASQIAAILAASGGQNNNSYSDRPLELVLQLGDSEFIRVLIKSMNELFKQEGRVLLEI